MTPPIWSNRDLDPLRPAVTVPDPRQLDGEDVYLSATQAYLDADRPIGIGSDPEWTAEVAAHKPLRAAIDRAVELTEQRIGADSDRPSLVGQNIRLMHELARLEALNADLTRDRDRALAQLTGHCGACGRGGQ